MITTISIFFNCFEIYSHIISIRLCFTNKYYLFGLHHLFEIFGHSGNIHGYVYIPENLLQVLLLFLFNLFGFIAQFYTLKLLVGKREFLLVPTGVFDLFCHFSDLFNSLKIWNHLIQ